MNSPAGAFAARVFKRIALVILVAVVVIVAGTALVISVVGGYLG